MKKKKTKKKVKKMKKIKMKPAKKKKTVKKKRAPKEKKLWAGRFEKEIAIETEKFTASIDLDKRLYKQDIAQSIAYAKALAKARVTTSAESKKIIESLEKILRGVEKGKINFKEVLEDVHMNIESILADYAGEAGKKIHTGRSRNDQVATDLRMYLKDEINTALKLLKDLMQLLVYLADRNLSVLMPGYTHLQRAQPILLSHYLMAYFEMFKRDRERLKECLKRTDVMPLGSAALAGNDFPLDRKYLAELLDFSEISANSIDAVSDRDFVIDYLHSASLVMLHLSKFCEEIVIYSSYEFKFINLPESFSTGSSLMPQKKNPDVAELIRGKTGRVFGHLLGLLTTLKGLPLAYNRDLQEDKFPLFDTIDTLNASLSIFTAMLKEIEFNEDVLERQSEKGAILATDLVYYLVKKGVPFRKAHEIVGKVVAYCEDTKIDLAYLSHKELKKFSPKFGYEVSKVLNSKESVNAKITLGGTSPKRVKEAIESARKNLLHD